MAFPMLPSRVWTPNLKSLYDLNETVLMEPSRSPKPDTSSPTAKAGSLLLWDNRGYRGGGVLGYDIVLRSSLGQG